MAIVALLDPDGDIAPLEPEQPTVTHRPSSLPSFTPSLGESPSVNQYHPISTDTNCTNPIQKITTISQPATNFTWPSNPIILDPLTIYTSHGVNNMDIDGHDDYLTLAARTQSLIMLSSSAPAIDSNGESSPDSIDISRMLEEWNNDTGHSQMSLNNDSISHQQIYRHQLNSIELFDENHNEIWADDNSLI